MPFKYKFHSYAEIHLDYSEPFWMKYIYKSRIMVFNATFNTISVIS